MAETRKIIEEIDSKPEEQNDILGELTITLSKAKGIGLHVKEGSEMEPIEIEMLIRNVYEQLHEQRIAQMAIEIFKSRL
jgi:hypothetical protein